MYNLVDKQPVNEAKHSAMSHHFKADLQLALRVSVNK